MWFFGFVTHKYIWNLCVYIYIYIICLEWWTINKWIHIYIYVFICLYQMDSFTTYSLRCSMNSIVFPPHTQLFGFWCFLHLHCRAKISSVVWIFYLLIFNSFEKKHYITKFPDFFKQFEKSNQWKHSKHAGTYFLVFSFSLVVSMVSCISKKCSIILSMVFPFFFPLFWLFVSMFSV